MEIRITEAGHLKIIASNEELDSLPVSDSATDEHILASLLEPCWTNGQYYVFNGDQLGHMTGAEIIAEDATYEDDGSITIHGRVWWFPNYAIESCIETLRKAGEVVFTYGYTEDAA